MTDDTTFGENRILGFTEKFPQVVILGPAEWNTLLRMGMLRIVEHKRKAYPLVNGIENHNIVIYLSDFIPDGEIYVIEDCLSLSKE